MKTLLNITILPLLLLFAGMPAIAAKNADYTREIKKEFSVNPDAKLVLENKFGDIRITASAENKVTILVQITAEARDLESAVKVFEKIQINFNSTPDLVEARTVMENNISTKGRFSIDYTVSMPVTMSLDADNRFGDLVAGEIGGKAKLTIGYGNLQVNRLSNSDNLVEVKFGKANIDWIKGAVMILKYSEFNTGYAGSLNLNSSYSDLSADKIIALDALFEGGNIKITDLSVITGKSKFSDITIGTLGKKIEMTNNYGNFTVRTIPVDFASINVTNSYGNIDLGITRPASYTLDADMHFCNLDYDKTSFRADYLNDSSHDLQVRGTFGTDPKGTVKVSSNYGNVSLRNK